MSDVVGYDHLTNYLTEVRGGGMIPLLGNSSFNEY